MRCEGMMSPRLPPLQEGTNSTFGITDQLALNMLLEEARAGRCCA